MKQLIATS